MYKTQPINLNAFMSFHLTTLNDYIMNRTLDALATRIGRDPQTFSQNFDSYLQPTKHYRDVQKDQYKQNDEK